MAIRSYKAETLFRMAVIITAVIVFVFILFLSVEPKNAFAAGPPFTITDPGGGDCSQIGAWNAGTKTCTLNQDVNTPGNYGILIASNNITLDGAGHTLTGSGLNLGVFASNKSGITIKNIKVDSYFFGIEFVTTTNSEISDCTVSNSNEGISILAGSNLNFIMRNVLKTNSARGIRVADSNTNTLSYNTLMNGSGGGIYLDTTNNTWIYGNNFVDNAIASDLYGSGNTNVFLNELDPIGGNYWARHDMPSEGCVNANNDRYCDSGYAISGMGTDSLPVARRGYYFTWYDQVSSGARNWVLMVNPSMTAGEYGWFDLSIAGVAKTLPASTPGLLPGQVGPTGFGLASSITPSFPGVMDGPVDVGYHARSKQIVSQRTLWGDSLEEVTGTDAASLSDHYYWTWYDMASPGFKNWILVANPSASETVTAFINFTDVLSGTIVYETHSIAPGGRWTPTYPGMMGGPVEVKAWHQGGLWPADARNVIASQRVLINNDTAFNEVPGIPAGELSDRYVWTWYDQQSAGAKDWILVANPADSGFNMDYSIFIHGHGYPGGVDLAPGESAAVQISGLMNGPVEVDTVQHNSGIPLKSIVSQRSIWGPSFEEVPGMPYADLSSLYFSTWYDQVSPNVTNWVQVANPDSGASLFYAISIGGQDPGGACSSGTVAANSVVSCTFPGTMNGPVRVQAWTDALHTALKNVLTSQRVLWKGYFNEVMGTASG